MDAPAAAKSGHSGTAMALAPLGVMLWSRLMRHDPTDALWSDRDRFILSCGHASILQYGLAHSFGYDLTPDDLRAFRQPHSRTPGHPENGVAPTVEVTTGPLGQGIANGVGMAIAERILRSDFGEELVNHRTWVIAGDGCLEEGISHEAASLAGSLGLDRLTVFYDDNHITIDGPTELALHDDAAMRFSAYGWHVINVGEQANDLDVLEAAAREAMAETSRPSLVIVRSHIGFPSPEMMDRREAHGSPFSRTRDRRSQEDPGRRSNEPFHFDPELPQSVGRVARRPARGPRRVGVATERRRTGRCGATRTAGEQRGGGDRRRGRAIRARGEGRHPQGDATCHGRLRPSDQWSDRRVGRLDRQHGCGLERRARPERSQPGWPTDPLWNTRVRHERDRSSARRCTAGFDPPARPSSSSATTRDPRCASRR